jgi:tetratricopeptide (TPR) repeat protein
LGDVRRHLGQHQDAKARYEEALGIYRSEPKANPLDVANALRSFAILKEKMGDFDGARAFWREARGLYNRSVSKRESPNALSISPNWASREDKNDDVALTTYHGLVCQNQNAASGEALCLIRRTISASLTPSFG